MALQARASAEWVRQAVVYEVNTRNFSAAGNFAGVTDRLDQIAALGATVVWLMPIHPIGLVRRKGTLGSPYSVRDYYAIEPSFGTAADLTTLVQRAHRIGLRVIIDIVANHAAWDSVMMARPEFWMRDATGAVMAPEPAWADVAKLDYGNRALRDYMIEMLSYWIREFNLDGFRCDVAGLVPTDFWNEARAALERVKPGLFLLAEWRSADLLLEAFDAGYGWPFYKALNAVFIDGASALTLRDVWQQERASLPVGALELRFSDNHDETRAVVRFGERAALAASVLVFMLDGIALLYNGQEIGDTAESGAPALFECMPIFWGNEARRAEFRPFYQTLIGARRRAVGAVEWIEGPEADRVARFRRGKFEVAVNCTNRAAGGLKAWGACVARGSEVLLELP